MGDLGIEVIDGVSRSNVFNNFGAWNDPSQGSVEAWTAATLTASTNRSAREQGQSAGAKTPAVDKAKTSDHTSRGSWLGCGLGLMQAGVGVLETVGGGVFGVVTAETGIGAIAAGVVILHGLDDIQAGVRQAWTGKPTETFTRQAVEKGARQAGVPAAAAAVIGIGVDIAAGGGVGGAEKAAVKGAEGSILRSADEAYTAIRASTTDVAHIASNTGYKVSNIQKVKNYLFMEEHLLDRYESLGVPAEWRRFDSDIAIAEAWRRLETGTFGPADVQLLRHETAEAWYMRNVSPSYNAAHDAAQLRFPAPE